VRLEWELTLETSNVVSWLSRDTHVTYQVLKRVWPAAQRDSLFWSTIRHCPTDDDDGPDYWIVVNYSTDCVPVSQVCHLIFSHCYLPCLKWQDVHSLLFDSLPSIYVFFPFHDCIKVLGVNILCVLKHDQQFHQNWTFLTYTIVPH